MGVIPSIALDMSAVKTKKNYPAEDYKTPQHMLYMEYKWM